MKHVSEGLISIAIMILASALLALIVSRKSQTANLITSSVNAFNTLLAMGLNPLVGEGALNIQQTGSALATSLPTLQTMSTWKNPFQQ
jgi:hypothetical protein